MATHTLLAQVKGLELQLTVLKTQMARMGRVHPVASFADLEGILADKTQSTEAQLDDAEYRAEWDDGGEAEP